jgi:hypothetical protein
MQSAAGICSQKSFFLSAGSAISTLFLPDHVVDFFHERRPLFDAVPLLLLPLAHQKVGRFYSVRRRQNVTDPVAQLARLRLNIRFVPRHLCWTPTCERETIIKHFKLLNVTNEGTK